MRMRARRTATGEGHLPVRRFRFAARFGLALAALTVASLAAQAPDTRPPQQPTFRGGANYVRVDLYASQDGRPVIDLRRDEIELLEDDVPQTVESFEHVRIPPGGPESLRVEPNSVRASQQMAADPRARVFVIFIDLHHLDPQVMYQVRTPLQQFMEQALGPDDLVAVVSSAMPASALTFTRRTSALSGVLGDAAEWIRLDARDATMQVDPVERLYEECYGPSSIAGPMIRRRREKLALDALENLVVHLGAIREERKTVLVVSQGWEMFEESRALSEQSPSRGAPPPPDDRLRRGGTRDGASSTTSGTSYIQCEADRMALAVMNHRDRMQEITGRANRSNVSFYPFAPLRIDSSLKKLGVLRGMAEDTDGLAVVNTNNIAEPMQRIIADTSSYYLLGYQSTNGSLDGKFRRITVRLRRSGVEVRARKGYLAVSASEMRSPSRTSGAAATRPDDAVSAALGRVARSGTQVPLRVRASGWMSEQGGGAGRLWIVGEIDDQTRKELAWTLGGRGDVTVMAGDGTRVASLPVEIPRGQATFIVVAPESGSLPAGDYTVRVRLRPATDDGRPLAEAVMANVPARASPLGEPVLLRRGPQTALQYVQTADLRFRRNERLRLELPTSSSMQASARLLDRFAKPLQVPATVTMRDDASGAFKWVVVDAPLAPFAAGDYVVEVTQDGVSQAAAFKVVP
jgi:VWFA-related protein